MRPFSWITRGGRALARGLLRVGCIAIIASGAGVFAQTTVTPTTVTAGRPQPLTLTVPAASKLPQDARVLTVTVGAQKAQVTQVRNNTVTFLPPAYAGGSGERQVVLFDDRGNELARGAVRYDAPSGGTGPLIWVLLFVLAAIPILMLWYDIHKAYAFADTTRSAIIGHVARDGLTFDELKLLLTELSQAPPGIPGLARTMMAFMLLFILSIALFYILFSGVGDVPPIVDKTLTVLTTALTTVIAFYFGARTAATAAAQGQAATSASQPLKPAPLAFMPQRGKVGDEITIAGSGFGTTKNEVTFGSVKATNIPLWSDKIIKVEVPAGLTVGQKVAIEVVPQGAAKLSSAPNQFEVQ